MENKIITKSLEEMQNKIMNYYDQIDKCIEREDLEGMVECYKKQAGIREAMDILRNNIIYTIKDF